jgi:dynein heavy chain, axonemal
MSHPGIVPLLDVVNVQRQAAKTQMHYFQCFAAFSNTVSHKRIHQAHGYKSPVATRAWLCCDPFELQAKALAEYVFELENHKRLASTFDICDIVSEARNRLKDIQDELIMAKDVWDTSLLCEQQFGEWKKTLWNDINTETMEDASKVFVKEVRSINKVIRDEDCYKGLDGMVKAFTTSLPLVAELRSPAMRDRHWAALMAATKKDINLADPSFSLQELLDLELHKYEEEVGDIVDQASKEEKMEAALTRLSETWEKMEFQFVQNKGTADVYCIKMAEEEFETLEDNQVLVQGMMANRFCATFADPTSAGCDGSAGLRGKTPGIMGWNKSLNGVADVYSLMSEIQRTWAYLESLFIHSDEVKKELPEATKRFEQIDAAVKARPPPTRHWCLSYCGCFCCHNHD